MRGALALGASALAGVAAVISALERAADLIPFFVALTFMGGLQAWAAQPPFVGSRRGLVRIVALLWLFAALAITSLLLAYNGIIPGPQPARTLRGPEATYLGLTATVYHLVALYGGLALTLSCAFVPDPWFPRPRAKPSN